MAAKETIFQKCISLHGVPENIGADVLRHEIQQQHSVTVVRIDEVIGAEANINLKRWNLELEGEVCKCSLMFLIKTYFLMLMTWFYTLKFICILYIFYLRSPLSFLKI